MSYGDRGSEPLPLPTTGWFATRAALWSADLAIAFLLLLMSLAAPSSFGPMWGDAGSPSIYGAPATFVLYVVGVGLAIVGRLWMERILRAGREPEAHDEFWWSRT